MIVADIIETMALTRAYLDRDSRRTLIRFTHSCWNPDGGVRGRGGQSDLYYTVFAAICLRALHGRIPLLRLWKYIRSFDDGASLDIIHLFCLVRLRTVFPMSKKARSRLVELIEEKRAESATDMFFKVVMAEYLNKDDRPDAELVISNEDRTSDLAAKAVVNHHPDKDAEDFLMQRYCGSGGFLDQPGTTAPDLYSTATALFALRLMSVDLRSIRSECLAFIESLRRESGGFSCCASDPVADTEGTFYALLSLGCLM